MNQVFKCLPENFFRVPDGTLVDPFLNPKDKMSGIPWGLLDGLSVTAGRIPPATTSDIHLHPFITQVTILLHGELLIRMKDAGNIDPPYSIRLELSGDEESTKTGIISAVLTLPGTFFQLDNSLGKQSAHVLYISTPTYVFEPSKSSTNDPPEYDDAITLGQDWDRLRQAKWNPPELSDPKRSFAARHQAIQRLAMKRRGQS